MSDSIEKIYCTEPGSNNDCLAWASMMNNNNWNNNPFMYLIWLVMMRQWGWRGGDSEYDTATNFNSRQIAALQDTVNTNNNNRLAMDAINGNTAAISQLAQTFNTDYNTMAQSLCGIKSAIETVGGKVGYSAERVINAVNLGDANIVSALKDCCCQNKELVQKMGYENQIANERQTGILGSKIDAFSAANQLQHCQGTSSVLSRIDQLANGITQGFASIGYQNSKDTADIITAINASQQKTADQLALHWQAETSQALQDAKFEVSQLKQNQYLANLINNGSGCICGGN